MWLFEFAANLDRCINETQTNEFMPKYLKLGLISYKQSISISEEKRSSFYGWAA